MRRLLLIILLLICLASEAYPQATTYAPVYGGTGFAPGSVSAVSSTTARVYGPYEPETINFFAAAAGTATSTMWQVNENIKAMKLGGTVTLPGFTCNLSGAANYYFVTNPSTDLTQYIGLKVVLTDAGAKTLTFWPFNVGTGETLSGTNFLQNPTFDVNTLSWSCTLGTLASVAGGASNNCLELTATSGSTQTIQTNCSSMTTGRLNKLSAYVKSGTSGDQSYSMYLNNHANTKNIILKTGTSSGSWVLVNVYATIEDTGTAMAGMIKNTATLATMLFDEFSIQQVVTPSATGVTATTTIGGTAGMTVDGGFNYNAASYTAVVSLN